MAHSIKTLVKNILCLIMASNCWSISSFVTIIENDSQLAQILQEKPYTLIEFYAPWCHVCQNIQKPLETISNSAALKKHVYFAQIDIDKFSTLKQKYAVEGVPTFIHFKQGKVIKKEVGIRNIEQFSSELLNSVQQHLKLTQTKK